MQLIATTAIKMEEEFPAPEDGKRYLEKWQDDYGINGSDFYIENGEFGKPNYEATLHSISNHEKLLKIAIDLGVETPDFIPSIPKFRNEIKSSYKNAHKIFEKAFKDIEEDPATAIGLANSTLESIIKEIIKNEHVNVGYDEKDTLQKLTKKILNAFKLTKQASIHRDILNISSGLLTVSLGIENLRSSKTGMHGKTSEDYMVNDSMYAYFIVNSVCTVGLFLKSYYEKMYIKNGHKTESSDELPF